MKIQSATARLLIAALSLSGCVALQKSEPKPPRVDVDALRIVHAHELSAQVRREAKALRKSKHMAPEMATRVILIADIADAGLQRARDHYFDGRLQESSKAIDRVDGALVDAQIILQRDRTYDQPAAPIANPAREKP